MRRSRALVLTLPHVNSSLDLFYSCGYDECFFFVDQQCQELTTKIKLNHNILALFVWATLYEKYEITSWVLLKKLEILEKILALRLYN